MKDVDVLIVEDDAAQLRLLEGMIRSFGMSAACAEDLSSARAQLEMIAPRVILSDYHLPDGDGIVLCRATRREATDAVPYFILVTATAGNIEADALNRGVDDYLPKPVDAVTLQARVRVGLRFFGVHERLRNAAITDGLTGLYNHDHFVRLLEQEVGRGRRYGHPLSLLMMDLDHFKIVNDTHGHLAGNRVLQRVADILRANIRDVDTLARFGGEEFAIILPESRCAEAYWVAERMRETIGAAAHGGEMAGRRVTASFGVADSEDARVRCAADLIDLADRALYFAKRNGRDRVATAREPIDQPAVAEVIRNEEVESLKHRVAALSARTRHVYVQSIASLVQALDEKDPYSARHAANVSWYVEKIAREMGCSEGTIESAANAALLHDVGKVGVPDRILLKQSPLTPLERMVMQQVPAIGIRIVDHLQILEAEIQIIRHQREHYDGSGVPNGLKGDEIPIGARLLLAADAFDAMTTDRVYRARRPAADAMAELRTLSGRQFDPKVVEALDRAWQREPAEFEQRVEHTLDMLLVPSSHR